MRRFPTAQVKGCQAGAAREHGGHLIHPGCVEMAHIKARKLCTIRKHISHIGHLAGVQVTQARDGLEILHIVKPHVSSLWASIGERGFKDHFGHFGFGAIGVPTGIAAVRVQIVGRARAAIALVVVVERQRLVRRRVAGIGSWRMNVGEVARVARAAVDVGVGRVCPA